MVAADGQAEGASPAFELDHVLHGALSPSSLAGDDSTVVILQRRGHDFAGAGGEPIDEHDQRHILRQLNAGLSFVVLE